MRLTNYGIIKLSLLVICLFLEISFSIAQDLSIVNLSGAIVKHPKVSYDGTQMVFIANYDGRFKPYISSLDTGTWQTPLPIFEQDVSGRFEFQFPQLNFDNTIIYFSGKAQSKPDYDIYFTEIKNGVWSTPELLPININSNVDELSPSVSANGKKILFTRPLPEDAKADEYCQQIFLVEKEETGDWTPPEQLPLTYNTGCISAPYYASDNKTFYYSSYEEILDSEGKKLSKKQFNIFWGKTDGFLQYNPKPLISIVGENDNVSFSIDKDSTIYFGSGDILSSNSKKWFSTVKSSTLPKSLRPTSVTLVTGKVSGTNGNAIEAIVDIVDPYTSKVYQQVNCDASGAYQVFLPKGKQFSILASKESYSIQSQLITTDENQETVDFKLFQGIDITFNVYDDEFFFPLNSSLTLYDSAFNQLKTVDIVSGGGTNVNIGKELNIIFITEDYFSDTLNLPFHREVIFDKFEFDIELVRKLKQVGLSFTDDKTGNNLGLEITVFNVTRNEKTKRLVKNGSITLELRDGEVYEISTSAQGYSYFTSKLDLSKDDLVKTAETAKEGELFLNSDGVYEVKATLKSVKDQSIVMGDITFGANSYDLNALSYGELNKLVTYLIENVSYNVEISAHTDNAGAAEHNFKLSNLRANTVVEYLQDHAIRKNRLLAKGYGELNPISPNDTKDNMAKNRRVEFKILNNAE
jgi:outer membrane protein OmpA-like peptidoglycan-associated protein